MKQKNKKYTQEDYVKVHNLVYTYKNGSKEAGEELLNLFSAFLNRYVSLLHYGYYDIKHSSIRNFIKLFIESPVKRSSITSYKHNKGAGNCAAQETVDMIKSYFACLSKDDIKQEVYHVFLTMATKYKDTKPSFQNHIDKNFHFYAFRHFEKIAKDPLSRGNCIPETTNKYQSNPSESDYDVNITHLIKDHQVELDIEETEYAIMVEQSLNNSSITPLKAGDKKVSIFDDSFLDINWVNGITCSEVFKVLTPFERRILVMWYIEKKTNSQIADMFGLCRGTISNKKAKAKDKLEMEARRLNLSI